MAHALQPLRGIVPPMVTPLTEPNKIDQPGLERLIDHILSGGVHGLFVLGTTGEGPSLSYQLRRDLVTHACKQVDGRIPVLVGITDTAFEEAVAVATHAFEAGAAAVVAAPPPYFSTTQKELLGYFQRLASAVPLPVMLYNMPTHTKVFIEADTVAHAAKHPNIVGLKDSSGNMTYFHIARSLLVDRPDFRFFVGPEELLAETVLLGGHGGVNGGANLFPQLYVDLYNAAHEGNLDTVRTLHEKVILLSRLLYTVGGRGSSMLSGLKCALSLKGICKDILAEPYVSFSDEERAVIVERLATVEGH